MTKKKTHHIGHIQNINLDIDLHGCYQPKIHVTKFRFGDSDLQALDELTEHFKIPAAVLVRLLLQEAYTRLQNDEPVFVQLAGLPFIQQITDGPVL